MKKIRCHRRASTLRKIDRVRVSCVWVYGDPVLSADPVALEYHIFLPVFTVIITRGI